MEQPGQKFRGDKERIEQVLNNLLDNAVKYSPDANRIDVFISRQDGSIRVAIRDYGVGMTPDELNHIFEKFYRAEPLKHFKGLGLGLYIVKEIVDFHKGKIWVESKPDEGTTFVVELPLS
ncbi:MAG: ATP-binding protein [Bacteroidia bacterium]|nr:ATP-binding protein [Bacteroidia bacterium]